MTIKAILFDLDDTLYEEKEFIKSGFKEVAKFINNKFKVNEKIFYKILSDVFSEGIRGNIFNIALERLNINLDENIILSMVKVYREHIPKIKLKKNIKYLLLNFRKKYSLGIITDGYFEVQKNKVHALKLKDLFDTIVYTDSHGREFWKPNISGYKLALKNLEILPEEAIYIGDNPNKDFVGAKKIGIITIRLLCQGREYSQVRLSREYEADYEVKELANIINIIKILRLKNKKRNK